MKPSGAYAKALDKCEKLERLFVARDNAVDALHCAQWAEMQAVATREQAESDAEIAQKHLDRYLTGSS